ncbi:MAG: hypothetical protein HYW05_01280 [Candidatus Diapherotrites archaeon]|nr:hypothetical protein [Candidatus Diapherotrites archaeon]
MKPKQKVFMPLKVLGKVSPPAYRYAKKRGLPGKFVSPETYFIRTGEVPEGISKKGAKRIGTRFLSGVWQKEARANVKSEKDLRKYLPTMRQRVYGSRQSMAGAAEINRQIMFAMDKFARHFNPTEKKAIEIEVRKKLPQSILSVNVALREKGGSIHEMRRSGKELYHYLKDGGEMFMGLMQDKTGKAYFRKGWVFDPASKSTPLHEVIHVLQKIGVIKIDIPFAQAADRVLALEHGFFKPNPNVRAPTAEEFNRRPQPEKKVKGLWYEAEWSDDIGIRVGEWIYKNLPANERWDYLYLRCMGNSHQEALGRLRAAMKKEA